MFVHIYTKNYQSIIYSSVAVWVYKKSKWIKVFNQPFYKIVPTEK